MGENTAAKKGFNLLSDGVWQLRATLVGPAFGVPGFPFTRKNLIKKSLLGLVAFIGKRVEGGVWSLHMEGICNE